MAKKKKNKTKKKKNTLKTKKKNNKKSKKKQTKKVSSKKQVNNIKTKKNKKKKHIKKEYDKSKRIVNISVLIIILITIIVLLYFRVYVAPIPSNYKYYIDDHNYFNVDYELENYRIRNKIYCLFKYDEEKPKVDDESWTLSLNNNCIKKIEEDNRYYVFLKNEDNKIYRVYDTEYVGKILSIKTNKEKVYLPINGSTTITSEYESIGYIKEEVSYTSENSDIAFVEDGKIIGKSKGNTKIIASIMGAKTEVDVIVTDVITNRPSGGYDYSKAYLPCDRFSEDENNLIDEILKEKVNEVGYKTRAGVVEAARFLTLDFPYRINYFYENGRQTTNNVDGEGRYYHTGMYLHSSRYKNITGSKRGPSIWGCSLYSVPAKRNINNGLDCSGFVSWALLNGGFDVKDVGAGWSDKSDLTDFGTVKRLNTSLATSNTIKVGDLLHSERAGGHIGIIVGMDNDNYYVAQAIWYDTIGVIISKIKKSKLPSSFPHVVLMDKYYKEDGNLTNMW